MNGTDLQPYRKHLEALSARVRSDVSTMIEQSQSGSGGKGGRELSNAPLHLGDMGTEEYLYDLNTTLLENEQFLASEARDALRRIDEGNYGKCESCGRSISRMRLEAIPYARCCARCAKVNDATPQVNLNAGRPRMPADTLAPEGEMQENRPRCVDAFEAPLTAVLRGDVYAAGTAGGGTAVGGLAGSNEGHGEPSIVEVQEATGSGNFDVYQDRLDPETPRGGPSGGAVGGTPARKRAT